MESRFFVEAKSFLFSMVNGSNELRVVEKRKGFFGFVLLGWQCAAWLVSMVEEVLRNTVFEDFVKSYMEGSKVTIVRRGRNRFGRFLEVAVYAMGDRRGMTLFPEGQDGRGWNRVFEELSKALDFLTEGDVECECDTSGQEEDGIFRKLLEIFGEWLDWVGIQRTWVGPLLLG
jgi:hypothetical protein